MQTYKAGGQLSYSSDNRTLYVSLLNEQNIRHRTQLGFSLYLPMVIWWNLWGGWAIVIASLLVHFGFSYPFPLIERMQRMSTSKCSSWSHLSTQNYGLTTCNWWNSVLMTYSYILAMNHLVCDFILYVIRNQKATSTCFLQNS